MATNNGSPNHTSGSEMLNFDNRNLDPAGDSHQRNRGLVTAPGGFGNDSSEITQRHSTRRHQVRRPENGASESETESSEPTVIPKAARSAPYRSGGDSSMRVHEEGGEKIIVTGEFPSRLRGSEELIEVIRDPENQGRTAFLRWENGSTTILHSIEREGQIFVPPDPTARSFPMLSLPSGLLPCGKLGELLNEIGSAISKFVRLRGNQLWIVTALVLASWFPDCFDAAPYLWVVGPLGSGKTTLLKLLQCLCRRGLIVGDLRSGSLYKLVDTWDPTLIIDELEFGSSAASIELLRLLRTGFMPGVSTFRDSQRYSTYCLKVISSRQPFGDAALLSRGLTISMLSIKGDIIPLNEAAMQKLQEELQPKLLMFRLQNHAAVKNITNSANAFDGLSAHMRQIARALSAPLLGHAKWTSEFITILRNYDDQAQIERSLEPEWLVAEFLLANCHEGLGKGRRVTCIAVGGLAVQVNKNLEYRHEEFRLTAKKTGLVLKSLGFLTRRLGNWGRGLALTGGVQRKIHEVAAQLGIDRRTIAPLAGLESGYGGTPCALCEEFGLTGGLRFGEINKPGVR